MRIALILGTIAFIGCSAAKSTSGTIGILPIDTASQQGSAGAGGSSEITTVSGTGGSDIYITPANENGGSGGSEQTPVLDAGPQILDGNVCGSVTIKADVDIIKQSGNLLVIFDRSSSMSDDWNASPRYQAAGQALIAGITPLKDLLVVGGIFFPCLPTGQTECDPSDIAAWLPGGACSQRAGNSCEVTEIASTDQISFRPGPDFITEVPNQWFLQGARGTPLGAAITRADQALSASTLKGTTAVLIMTDGQPNCETAEADVISTVTKWNTSGIKSYVVGLPGSSDASAFLTQVAVAGGTTDFISPDDPSALQKQISTIVVDTVKTSLKSCTINLQQDKSADLANLHLIATEKGKVGEVLRKFAGGGWSVNADGTVATLEGKLCEYAKNGRFESIRFDFGCVVVPIILN